MTKNFEDQLGKAMEQLANMAPELQNTLADLRKQQASTVDRFTIKVHGLDFLVILGSNHHIHIEPVSPGDATPYAAKALFDILRNT